MKNTKFTQEENEYVDKILSDFVDWMDQFSTNATKVLGFAVPIYLLLHTFIF